MSGATRAQASAATPMGAARCERCGHFAATPRMAALAAPCLWEWQGDANDHRITIDGVELHVWRQGEVWLATMRRGERTDKVGLGYLSDHHARSACALSLGVGEAVHTWPARGDAPAQPTAPATGGAQ